MITLSKAVTKSKNDGTKSNNFNFYQYVWIFVVSCLLGYAIETLWCFIRHGYIESRKSLVLGHLSLAYGMGAVLLTLILSRFQKTNSGTRYTFRLTKFLYGLLLCISALTVFFRQLPPQEWICVKRESRQTTNMRCGWTKPIQTKKWQKSMQIQDRWKSKITGFI